MARRNRRTDFSPNVMSLEETIQELNTDEITAVYDLLKDRRDVIARSMTRTLSIYKALSIGTLVEFDASRGRVIRGHVTKINRKTINVMPEGAQRYWRVAASLLRIV